MSLCDLPSHLGKWCAIRVMLCDIRVIVGSGELLGREVAHLAGRVAVGAGDAFVGRYLLAMALAYPDSISS